MLGGCVCVRHQLVLEDHTTSLRVCTRQKVQWSVLIHFDTLVRNELIKRLSFSLAILSPQIVRNFENRSGRPGGSLDLFGGRSCAGLGFVGGSRDISVGQKHLTDFTAGLVALGRLAWWVSGLKNGRQHGFNGTDGVFGGHGIRNVLGSTLGVVHGGKDKVRDDLEVQCDSRRNGKNLGVGFDSFRVSLSGGLGKVGVGLGGGVELEDSVCVLSVFSLLLDNVGHEFRDRLGSSISAIGERRPRSIQKGTGHGRLESLKVTLGHDGLDDIDGSSTDESLARLRPLGEVEDDKEGKVLERVGRPAGRRSGCGTNVFDDTLGDFGLSNQGGVFLALGQVLDQTAGPTNTFGLAAAGLGCGGRVCEELFQYAEKRVGVVQGGKFLALWAWGVLQDGCDTSFEEGKVHEADAAQVGFLFVFGDDFAQSSNDFLGCGSKSHDALVFSGDGKVIQGEASKVSSVSAFLCQTLSKRSQNVVLSAADHGDTILLVTNITQFVNALCGGGTLFSLGVEHSFNEVGDVLKSGRLGGGTLGRLFFLGSRSFVSSRLSCSGGGLLGVFLFLATKRNHFDRSRETNTETVDRV
mmetsp:Transcript_6612/g.12001  ORF Transcript_6612/g.12001 Transcript_6612/m.12001 type:complete len:580 (+) Transcript_6612:191-1930(+)